MTTTDDPATPREPEIEFLGRMARRGLFVLRCALWLAGAGAIGYGVWRALIASPPPDAEVTSWPSAAGALWLAAGVPMVLPTRWFLERTRGQSVTLGACVLLWFAPMLLADDSAYGFVVRMFATLCAFLSLIVWRTLWRLGEPADGAD